MLHGMKTCNFKITLKKSLFGLKQFHECMYYESCISYDKSQNTSQSNFQEVGNIYIVMILNGSDMVNI